MRRALILLCCVAATCAAQAAPFADPTRPPRAPETDRAAAAGGPRLESVLIAPDRRVAVISGQQVTVGSRFGDAEVVRITESEVLIRGPAGVESLKLLPRDDKRPSAAGKGN